MLELKADIEKLEQEIEADRQVYEKYYGSKWKYWLKAPVKAVTVPAGLVTKPLVQSFAVINPFDNKEKLEDMEIEELLERRMHVKEKIAAQQSLVTTLNQAFDSELALKGYRSRRSRTLQVFAAERYRIVSVY